MQSKRDNIPAGLVTMLAATLVFSATNTLTKHISFLYPAPQILWVRYALFFLYSLILTLRSNSANPFISNVLWLQIFRSTVLCIEIIIFIVAVRYLPLAKIQTISSLGPMLTAVLSVFIIGEKLSSQRWIAILAGFIGLMIIIRPGFSDFDIMSILPVFGISLYALYQVLTRIVTRYDSNETTVLYTGFIGLIIMSAIGPFFWIPFDLQGFSLIFLLASMGLIGHIFLIKALTLSPASVLQPLNYLMIVWVTIFGILFFNEIPSIYTVIGAIFIISSGLYTFYIENKHN